MAQKISLANRRIWITGASSGIGKAIAQLCISEGAKVAVSARSVDKLNELVTLSPDNVIAVPFDVMEKSEHQQAVDKINQAFKGIDIVILNAGDCKYIDIDHFTSDKVEYMQKINFISMAYSLEYVLPLLKQSSDAQIVAVSSSAAYLGFPRAEAYGASKAAIKYFFESLRADLTRFNIAVSVVFPGFVKTPLTDKNDFNMPMRIPVEKAAKDIIKGIKKRKKEIITPWFFVSIIKMLSHLPIGIKNKMLAKMVRK